MVGISQSIANNAEQVKLYPNAEVIGAWNEPDVEYLISKDVDLVIGYATSKPKNAEVLAATGIPVVYVDCTKPETMVSDIIEVGKIVGKEELAEEAAEGTQGCSVNNLTLRMDELNSGQSSLSCLLCILHSDTVHLAAPNCDV